MTELPEFKEPQMEEQYLTRDKLLQDICADFCDLSRELGIAPVVTRVCDAIECHADGACESGVHPQGRAVDFRDEHQLANGTARLYSDSQAQGICARLNFLYPRTDGKLVALSHRFDGGLLHFHLQIPPGKGVIHEIISTDPV